MNGWSIALWAVGGLVALAALLKIMTARRNEVVGEWQKKVADEAKKKKKTESKAA
jgi:beta-lactamase regulating signal transducer with metallopeptidase domain